jgi:hypothetical protein
MDRPQLTDLKATLPNFPEAVLSDWLLPYAHSEGWPPFRDDGAPQGSRWPYLLGKKSLKYWTSVNWSLHYGHIELDQLNNRTQDSIGQMVLAAINNETNLYSVTIPDLKDRFDSIFSHLISTGNLPGTPTLLKEDDGYRVMDGNHRIAAYILYRHVANARNQVVQPQSFWVGAT